MIEVIFIVPAGGKIATGGGSLETLPQKGQVITIKGDDYRILRVPETVHKSPNKLAKPEIDVEPVL